MSNRNLEAEYRATTYRVTIAAETIDLRIDQRSDPLDAVLADAQVDEWVFITAWNPRSQECPKAENERRQQALVALLQARGKHFEPGLGVPAPASKWTAEESFLVWPVGRAEAEELRERFDQNAVVWGRAGHPAELLLGDSAS